MAYIREMIAEDIPAVVSLEAMSFTVPWSELLLSEAMESPLDSLWILEEDGQIQGYYNLRVIAGEGELMRIAVNPEARGRGYGRKLMEHLERYAAEKKAEDITLEVRASNEAAVSLYKSCGFRTEAVRKKYYTHPVEDALIMWHRHH